MDGPLRKRPCFHIHSQASKRDIPTPESPFSFNLSQETSILRGSFFKLTIPKLMSHHLILRVHADQRLGLGHVARALAIEQAWKAMGGKSTLAISGDVRARRVGSGQHPFFDSALPCEAIDLGEDLHAPLPSSLKGDVVLIDQWDTTESQINALRPHKIAVMEDDGDAHEAADLLFQPFLEGASWPDHPIKVIEGRKQRPFETMHGGCHVLRGSQFIVVDRAALEQRPRRESLQPLAVHKLLVTFGGSDGAGLAERAFKVLKRLVEEDRWVGSCTLLAPKGIDTPLFAGCSLEKSIPGLTRRIADYDAIWCSAGVTLSESLCMGVPVAAWGQNDRQQSILMDLAQTNACFNLGEGPLADLGATTDALTRWLGPEGQDARQEQVRDGMALVDGMGASRVAQALWRLCEGTP
jgi:spore coat polysaccharide biosynthesis predicted glycosyltransferase SpsG